MPLFRRIDPDPHALIAYIVARSRDREITLTTTKLVKLLYLMDVERVRSRGDLLTGYRWVFFHYGPYAFELMDTLEAMEGSELVVQKWHDSRLFRAAPGAPDGADWNAGTKSLVDRIVTDFAGLEQNELLDWVYFHTGPMQNAVRGQPLDMSRARDYSPPHRRPPLAAPTPPADIAERLARWRGDHAARLIPVSLDPPGGFLGDSDKAKDQLPVSGRLHVPDDLEF
jgi:Protein of unknown function (DUF4065)